MITVGNRNGILLFLNRLSLFCHTALTVLFIAMLLYFALTLAGFTSLLFPPTWILLLACGLSVPELLAAVVSNKILAGIDGGPKAMTPLDQGELLVKRKFAWMYAPDKLERWLNEMESRGYSLHSVGRRGRSFFFSRDGQKQQYCLDYQLMADCEYMVGRIQAGFKPLFSTYGSFGKWIIWAKEYSPEQEAQSSCNNAHLTKFGLRAAAAYTGVLVSMLALYGAGLVVAMDNTYGFDQVGTVLVLALFGLIILAMVRSTVQIWLYYRRMKIQAQNL